ncbi:phage tail protein [Clostridium sp. YIM B02569]|uniref:phage tail protein n=1 Tax=Clostridium sp. YIM B02569 TaxID=2911967 RepID=UPI001EEA8C1B|nr:phage tail protein [Clostridium sp. YIM B02569]
MAENFYTILTTTGKAKIANSAALGTKVNFKTLKVGDGNGAYYEPTENQTSLINKVWEGNIGAVTVDETNSNWIVTETTIPASDGGFFIREAGIFDEDGDLIAIAKMAATYKPVAAEGTTKDLSIRIILEVSNSSSITLKVDPNVIIATKKDIQIISNSISSINTQLSDMVYQAVGGSATAITLTIKGTLVTGYPITFIASANNGGAATTINGKKLYKPGTTTSPNLISGKAYTVWYNSTGDCFFIKASAEGTALASDVRKSKTFSNDNDTGIVGDLDLSLLVSGNIRAGITIDGVTGKSSVVDTADATVVANHMLSGETCYKNGAKITGTMVDRSGDTACVSSSISGTTLKLKASEGYRDGVNDNVTITDEDFIAANIVKNKNVLGLVGTHENLTPFIAGTTQELYNSNADSYLLYAVNMTKACSFTSTLARGTVTVNFRLLFNNASTTAAQIYVNDVARGVYHVPPSSSSLFYTEDISVEVGDIISIYVKSGYTSGIYVKVDDITITCGNSNTYSMFSK